MEKLTKYRQIVRELLTSHTASGESSNGNLTETDVECQLIFDLEHDHYQILDVGWQDLRRVYACFIHLDIKDDKIWIQHNMTEADLGQELVERGVPASDIILGLHPPYKRPYTKYGIA
jgi:XisI protein